MENPCKGCESRDKIMKSLAERADELEHEILQLRKQILEATEIKAEDLEAA